MKLSPYFCLNGNAEEAMNFYMKALDGKLLSLMRFGEAPDMPIPEEAKSLILNAQVQCGDDILMMFSDAYPGQTVKAGEILSLAIMTDSIEESDKIFNALSQGGTVTMEMQKTFWSPWFGMLRDKYDTIWQISTDVK